MIAGQQLLLPVGLRTDASFENFYGQQSARCAAILKAAMSQTGETLVWIAGPTASGKSHLAAACLHYLENQQKQVYYLAMNELGADLAWLDFFLDAQNGPDVLILDDIQAWLSSEATEVAMFRLFNHFKMNGRQLLCTSSQTPAQLQVGLADLASRLRSGVLLTLQSPSDEDKQTVLVNVASQRGMHLGEDAAGYIIRRSHRDLPELLRVLGRVEQASLVEQRKLTIPFIKKVLGW